MNMRNLLSEFLTDERGARTIEYGLLAVGILVAIIATAAALGTGLDAAPQNLPVRQH
jgi:Flp pilus assembly pilin Flp